jgi:hypothetical protein
VSLSPDERYLRDDVNGEHGCRFPTGHAAYHESADQSRRW